MSTLEKRTLREWMDTFGRVKIMYATDFSRSSIDNWYHGRLKPSPKSLGVIALVLGIIPEQIVL